MKSIKKGIYINNKIIYKFFKNNYKKNIFINNSNIYINNIFKNNNIYSYNGKKVYKFKKIIFNNNYIKIKFSNLFK